MQPQTRKYLIFGGAGFVALLILFLALRAGSGGSPQSTCNDFIETIIAQDVDKSYKLLASDSQKQFNREAWKGKLLTMQPSFFEAKYELESTNDLSTPKNNDKEAVTRMQYNYKVSSPPIYVSFGCYVIDTDDGPKIDGFTMVPRQTAEPKR